jgi:hypothetical protein
MLLCSGPPSTLAEKTEVELRVENYNYHPKARDWRLYRRKLPPAPFQPAQCAKVAARVIAYCAAMCLSITGCLRHLRGFVQ